MLCGEVGARCTSAPPQVDGLPFGKRPACVSSLSLSSSSPNVLAQRKRKVILLGPGSLRVWSCFWPGSLLFLSFTFSVFRPLPRDVLMLGLFLLLENPSSSCFEAPFSWRCFCLCPYSFAGSAFSRLYLTLHPLPDRSHSRPRPLSLHDAHGLSHWEPLVHTLHPDISPTGRLHLHIPWV